MTNNETAVNTNQQNRIANVLIVDDDPALARFVLEILARKGIRGIVADSEETAAGLLDRHDWDLVLACEEIRQRPILPHNPQGGFKLLRRIRQNSPELPTVIIVDSRKIAQRPERIVAQTVNAMRAGFYDCMIKPLQREQLEYLLDTLLPNHDLKVCDSAEQGIRTLYRIVGKSEKLKHTVGLARKIAPTSVPVLIAGESGTGKELISHLIHHNSKRATAPYIRVNCAALSETLLESELFGHEKGAFTGAYTQRKGRFEMAHGGTLLLDEITETPLRFQAKLLRVLEQQDFERVGGSDNVRVDVRVISTTNKDLLQEVTEGNFRQDLYYRLSGVRLLISPLRERPEDLHDLIWHFVNIHAADAKRHITRLDPTMMELFTKYPWPGNVRQLRNVVLTSLILGTGETLSLADVSWLFDELQPISQEETTLDIDRRQSSDLAGVPLVQIEKRAILDTLQQTAGNKTKAAKVLGISDRTLRDKIRRYQEEDCLQPA